MLRLTKNEPIQFPNQRWNLNFNVPEQEGEILHISNDDRSIIQARKEDGMLTVSVLFDAKETPVILTGCATQKDSVRICNEHYKISLYINDTLWDEDWPIGNVALGGAECKQVATEVYFEDYIPEKKYPVKSVIRSFKYAQNFKPDGHNVRAGDCMPFYHDGTFHLFYLFDRRAHQSKWGLGAHQWAHISTKDLVNWDEHPLAIAVDKQEEGSICTGSVVFFNGVYYAYYAVRMYDGSPAELTWSTSKDGIHFEKSGKTFSLSSPYEPASARDPKVFRDDEGLFHMLVTTSLVSEGGNRGCLAHAVSEDLINWTQREPIVVLDIEDQPECCDYFYKNGLYYLTYCNYGLAHYFSSKEPFGPWTVPENNLVAHDKYIVPKMAFWKDGRIIFAGTISEGGFGGHVRFYEAKQRADGTLEFTDVPEMSE